GVPRKVALEGARVERIVMRGEQLVDQRVVITRVRRVAPALDGLSPVDRSEMREPLDEHVGRLQEVRVFVPEQRDAQRTRSLEADAWRRAHCVDERIRQLHVADLSALGFDIDDAPRIERVERGEEPALERLLRGLSVARKIAEQRAAMSRDAFE